MKLSEAKREPAITELLGKPLYFYVSSTLVERTSAEVKLRKLKTTEECSVVHLDCTRKVFGSVERKDPSRP